MSEIKHMYGAGRRGGEGKDVKEEAERGGREGYKL